MALLRDSLGFLLGPGSQEARALLLQKANVQVILTMPLKPGLGLGSLPLAPTSPWPHQGTGTGSEIKGQRSPSDHSTFMSRVWL